MISRRRLLVFLALLANLLLSSVGPAQTVEAPSDSDKATARKLMDVGDAKRKEGDLKAALEAYRGADDIMKVPTTGLDVGKVQIELGLLLEASTTLLRVSRYKHPEGEREPNAFLEAKTEAAQLAKALSPRIAEITLTPSGLPADVSMKVRIDGQPIPASANKLPRQLNPGSHQLDASAEGFKDISVSFELGEGEKKQIPLSFEVDPNASKTPPPPPTTVPPPPVPPEPSSGPGAFTWVAFGVGAAGIIAGSITGGLALSRGSELGDECAADTAPGDTMCSPRLQDDLDSATMLAHISTVSFAVGGAGVVAGVISLLVGGGSSSSSPSTEPATAQVKPLVGLGYLGLTGSF